MRTAINVINRARVVTISALARIERTRGWRGQARLAVGVDDDVHSAAIHALAATACTAACDAGGASLPATAPVTAPLAAAVSALSPELVSSRDDPGAAALRLALRAWHPDIQAGAAIVGGPGSGGVEAMASAGGANNFKRL